MLVLLIGNGYLGKHINKELSQNNIVYAPSSKECDVTSDNSVNEFIEKFKQIDMFVYCAVKKSKINCLNKIDNTLLEMLNVNLLGAIRCCNAVVPKMIKGSKIITIGSVDGTFGNPNHGMYCTTKAALHQYTRCLGAMLKSKEISVNCVVPGTLNNSEDAIAVAKLISFLSTSNKINCSMLRVDSGHHTFPI